MRVTEEQIQNIERLQQIVNREDTDAEGLMWCMQKMLDVVADIFEDASEDEQDQVGCKYCRYQQELLIVPYHEADYLGGLSVHINNGELVADFTSYSQGANGNTTINYCPMCGRKLEE